MNNLNQSLNNLVSVNMLLLKLFSMCNFYVSCGLIFKVSLLSYQTSYINRKNNHSNLIRLHQNNKQLPVQLSNNPKGLFYFINFVNIYFLLVKSKWVKGCNFYTAHNKLYALLIVLYRLPPPPLKKHSLLNFSFGDFLFFF